MRFTTEEQRAAIEQMWPDIGAYCESLGITRNLLLSGSSGIPVDKAKVVQARSVALRERKELAAEAGIGFELVSKIENGTRNPSAAALLRLCQAMGCTPASLLRKPAPVS